MKIKVVLVENEGEIRKLTVSLLNLYPDIECVGAFPDAESFLAKFESLQPDVVLMDIGLPGQSGIDCIRALKAVPRATEFIMFTLHLNAEDVFSSLAAGAVGYVVKGGVPGQLPAAIREVMAGGSPMSRQISRLVTQSFIQIDPQTAPELESLTEREWEVLRALDKGGAYKKIADEQFVSLHTIRTQIRSIYRKLQVNSRTEALNKFHGRG